MTNRGLPVGMSGLPLEAGFSATRPRDTEIPRCSGPVLVQAGEVVSTELAAALEAAGVREVVVRSPITCAAADGVRAARYGLDLATWRMPARHKSCHRHRTHRLGRRVCVRGRPAPLTEFPQKVAFHLIY
jgi:hypothetical protein